MWSVMIAGRPAKPVDPEAVLEKLIEHHPSTSYGDGILTTTTTVSAASVSEAVDNALEYLYDALATEIKVDHVEAMTEELQERELERSNLPDLVGIAEIAELAGTSRQRAFQMTANRGFPVALLELASGRLWSGPAVRSYLEGRPARPRAIAVTGKPIRRGRVMGRRQKASSAR